MLYPKNKRNLITPFSKPHFRISMYSFGPGIKKLDWSEMEHQIEILKKWAWVVFIFTPE